MTETPHNESRATLLMTKSQLAARLQISLGHLHKMTKAGRVPEPVRFGRRALFSAAVIDAWSTTGARLIRASGARARSWSTTCCVSSRPSGGGPAWASAPCTTRAAHASPTGPSMVRASTWCSNSPGTRTSRRRRSITCPCRMRTSSRRRRCRRQCWGNFLPPT